MNSNIDVILFFSYIKLKKVCCFRILDLLMGDLKCVLENKI